MGLGWLMPTITDGGDRVHKPRKEELPASGHWGYVPTWRDEDPNQMSALRRATYFKSLRKEDKFRSYFGDYIFMRPGTEMQYTWDIPSYKRSLY